MKCVVFCSVPIEARPGLLRRLAQADLVIAADGGARWALVAGLVPKLVIGDLDSIDASTLDQIRRLNVAIEVLPTDKDATDGELALRHAIVAQASEVMLVGAVGGPRFDHGLANCFLLTDPALASVDVCLLDNTTEVRVVTSGQAHRWRALPGEIVSLLPAGGLVTGVETRGLRWPLHGATLAAGASRGISNEATDHDVSVRVGQGDLFVVRSLPAGVDDWPDVDS